MTQTQKEKWMAFGAAAVALFCFWTYATWNSRDDQGVRDLEASLKRNQEYTEEQLKLRGRGEAESERKQLAQESTIIHSGDEVTISADGGPCVLIPKWEDNAELQKYLRASDKAGYQKMMLDGKALFCEAGNSAKVLQSGLLAYEVRLLTGIHAGKQGWVAREFVQKK